MQPIEATTATEKTVRRKAPNARGENEETKSPRTRRTLPGLTRKLSEMAAHAVEVAIREEEKNAHDHKRVKCICQIVFNGAFSTMLRNSTLLSAEDKEFLKDFNYL